MSLHRSRPRPSLRIQHRKHVEFESPSYLGSLSPDLQPSSPPTFHSGAANVVSKVGKYLLTQQTISNDESKVFKAVHCETQENFVCKVRCFSYVKKCNVKLYVMYILYNGFLFLKKFNQ